MTVSPAAVLVWRRRAVAYLPVTIAVALVAERTIAAVLAKVGHAGASLDDAYIHFQYARALAEGHPFRFQAGEPMTSGATSTLWPLVLAPFWAIGFRDDAILWPAWALSFLALGALAWEASKLAEGLAGRTAALGAGAMTLAFSGFTWFAASGMEVVPFAWAIARTSRRASEWAETPAPERAGRDAAEIVALAWIAALFRPEGAVTALFAAATLAAFPRSKTWRERLLAVAPAASVVAVPALLWVTTGATRSSTATVKLLPGNPYYTGAALTDAIHQNVKLLFDTLLDGKVWSAEFIPHHGAIFAVAGLGAAAAMGVRSRRPWRAAAVLLLALTMIAPCFYLTFLWNRLRYLWPFATGWIVGLACLARLAGDAAARLRPRWRAVTGIVCGVFAGSLASKLEWAIDDVAQSASGIDRQQVALGRWAKATLPPDSRIGLNDTGAIAYFGDRRTFDVVGLTTRDEARYWVAGAGSRLEHYERLLARSPEALPTHFIVYPEWMAMGAVLGQPLHDATVTDSTILGGRTMRAYEADWSKLGSGERPWSSKEAVVDAVDVADLESEADHGYQLAGAHDGEQVAREGETPEGDDIVDGGRTHRTIERFVAHLPPGEALRGIVRLEATQDTTLVVTVDGEPADRLVVRGPSGANDEPADEGWIERAFAVPPAPVSTRRIELRTTSAPVTVFHYWFVRAS